MGHNTHFHHAFFPVLVIPKPKRKLQLLLTSVCLCNHSTPCDSRSRRRYGEITYNEPGSSRLSSYRHGICLSILIKIRWGIRNTFAFLDCSLSLLPSGKKKKNPRNFSQFRSARGKGSGLTEDQWYLGPLHTR